MSGSTGGSGPANPSGSADAREVGPPTPTDEELTVVIPTLGRKILRRALTALAEGDVRPGRVVVVHQGDDPRVARWTAEVPAGLVVDYVRSDRRGRAVGVNRGLAECRSRYVAITDDDCLADETWISRMGARLRQERDVLVTGRVEPAGDEAPIAVVTSREFAVQRRPRLKHDSLSGGNMGAALAVLRRVGPLDEDPCLATAEDGEYAYRALRRGVPIVYDPDIVVSHVAWRDETGRGARYASYARSQAGFYGKYLRRGDLFIAARTALHFARSLRRWIAGSVRGDADRAANGRAYVLGLLPGLLDGWRSGR